jgi:metal-responsive CopG/Arc/MetJ family transcriptional regulator
MINHHTGGLMSTAKIAITIDNKLVEKIDKLVKKRVFPNRSRAIQEAVAEKLSRLDKSRLAKECLKLDKSAEQKMAEEGMTAELESWPEY